MVYRRFTDNLDHVHDVGPSDMFRSRLCGMRCIVSEPATALQDTYPYDILCAIRLTLYEWIAEALVLSSVAGR